MSSESDADKKLIDELVERFFSAFTNKGGARPEVQAIHELFIPGGVIVKSAAPAPQVYSLREFVEPREKLLRDGTLVDFEEAEVSERTDIFGGIAQRLSLYRKSGILLGRRFEARGTKAMQLVKMPAGWKLVSVAWEDEEAG